MSGSGNNGLPHFVIIGAMKSATTTIYEQLRLLDGIFMPALKEPNFFSDDEQYRRGLRWYRELFAESENGDILGEASTHYTKLPTYPHALDRMSDALQQVKIIYIMRDPIERLVSQYIHEWSCNRIHVDINQALEAHPELIQYSRYAYQLEGFIERYGSENILPVFFERIKENPESELRRIARFIGYAGEVQWRENVTRTNVSSERMRTNRFTGFLIKNNLLASLRRALVPRPVRDAVKKKMQMNERPELSEVSKSKLQSVFDEELGKIGELLGLRLTTQNYKTAIFSEQPEWCLNIDREKTASRYEYQ